MLTDVAFGCAGGAGGAGGAGTTRLAIGLSALAGGLFAEPLRFAFDGFFPASAGMLE